MNNGNHMAKAWTIYTCDNTDKCANNLVWPRPTWKLKQNLQYVVRG